MLHLLLLLESHCWYVFLIVGVAAAWFSIFETKDAHKFQFQVRKKPSWIGVGAAGVILTLGFVLLFFQPHKALLPDLAGRWMYQVTNGIGDFSHRGCCDIVQDGRELQISGTRKFACRKTSDGVVCVPVNAPWQTKWAELCTDGRIRFDYTISVDDALIAGHCSVLHRASAEELVGHYYMLPPFAPDMLNARHGQIIFTRMGANDAVKPPLPEELDSLRHSLPTVDVPSGGQEGPPRKG